MISEFSLRPKAQNEKSVYFFIGFCVGAVAGTVAYILVDTRRGLVGLAAMIFIIAAIYMYTRYMAAEYIYDVTVLNDTPMFIVRHKLGRREITMCRLALSSIVSVTAQTKEQRRAHKTPANYSKFTYSPTFDPELTYLIISRSRYEKAEVTIEANDEFAQTLMRYAEISRTYYAEDEDDEEDYEEPTVATYPDEALEEVEAPAAEAREGRETVADD